jgi:amino acid adenylation domain-containing protein
MIEQLILALRQKDILLRLENERLVSDAPRGALTPELIDQVQRNKDAIIEFLKQEREANLSTVSAQKTPRDMIPRVSRDIDIPLSFSQESLWFLEQLNPGTSAYNIPLRIRIAASMDTGVLRRSLDEILRRHEALRTRFRIVGGSPIQAISPAGAAPLTVIDLSNQAAAQRSGELEKLCVREAAKAFQIDQDVLLRATLLRLQAEEHVLLLTMHHIVADAASVDLVFNELFLIYRAFSAGLPSPLPKLRIQYADFAVWQRAQVRGEMIEQQVTYWKRQMAGASPVLELPIDGARRAGLSYKGSTAATVISKDLMTRLKAYGKEEGASLFMVLLAAFQVLLYRSSGQSDIVVGSPISGRQMLELESVVGLFVNTLPLRIDLSGNPTFRAVLSRVRDMVLEAHQNQDIPFETLVKELRPPRALGINPLFQVFFSFRSRSGEGALADTGTEIISSESAKFDLSLSVEEFSDGMKAEIEYSTDLFRRDRVIDLLERLTRLLGSIASAPEVGVDILPLIDVAERQRALASSNDTDVAYDLSRVVDEVILEGAHLNPEKEAVRFGNKALTYGQLVERVDDVALRLRDLGVRPDDVVGLCVERSLELIIGLLGILKSGAAFVPLDPHYPKDRLAYMVNDVRPVAILTQKRTEDAIPSSGTPRILLDDLPRSRRGDAPRDALGGQRRSTDLAYVIYTSGSTGSPKGVEISHRSLMNLLYAMRQQFGVTPNEAVLAVTTISFDIAMLELLLPLVCGGRVVLASREQAADAAELILLLREQKISMMQATPATWRLLLAAGWTGSAGLKVLCGGEAWSEDLAKSLLTRCASLWNMYGPTETTIWSAVRRIEPGDRVLIGRPIANTRFYVLGSNGEPEPTDMPGELFIGGTGVARGYRGRPDLTAERFVTNPFERNGQDRLYKTGDRVRRLPNGDIEFLGRLDSQVKIRGFRIELDEIAAVLRSHASLTDAVVVVQGNESLDKRLAAYCTGPLEGRPDDDDLRSLCRSKLPNYMTPSSFEFLERFPVTPSGKIDRKALESRAPPVGSTRRSRVPPRTKTERMIAKTWAKFLKVEGLGISDDVFDLGAHSLMVVQVIHDLNSSFGFRVGVSEVFENPTVEKLAAIAEEQQLGDRRSPRVIRLRQGGLDVPIYFIYAGPAELALARYISGDHPVFGIEVPWPLEWKRAVSENQTTRFPGMDEIVELFEGELRNHSGSGNCVIAGYSFAGLLAFEVARRYLARGGRVETVIVIDKWLPYPSPICVSWNNLRDYWTERRTDGVARTLEYRLTRSALVLWWAIGIFAKRLGSSLWLRPNVLTSFLDQGGIPLRWKLVERLYIEIERNFLLRPLDCRGIVIRPKFLDRHSAVRAPDEYLGWKMLFERGCEAMAASGDHFSMVREHGPALALVIGRAAKHKYDERVRSIEL